MNYTEVNVPPGFIIDEYRPEDNLACIELERNCPQGESFRAYIDRLNFPVRAMQFAEFQIDVFKYDSRIIGVICSAKREIKIRGKTKLAGYVFDRRIHPEFRGRGLGTLLLKNTVTKNMKRGLDLTYCVISGDNPDLQRESLYHQVGGFTYIYWPVYRNFSLNADWSECDLLKNHELARAHNGPFDFYTNPCEGNRPLNGFLKSLQAKNAGCSIWDGKDLHQNVVLRIPRIYPVLRYLLKFWPGSLRNLHVPTRGEHLREWTVFDFWASSVCEAINLAMHVNNLAKENKVHFVSFLTNTKFAYARALRSVNGALLTQVIPVVVAEIGSNSLLPFENIYADIRD